MKPILFDGSATNFNTQGIGALSDCISALVTEQRNGIYELEFTYPITGVRYEDITAGRIVVVSHDERKDLQPFIIYRISLPISGVVTVNAHHISYELNNVIVGPYEATNIGTAFEGFHSYAITDNSFTFWTDKTSAGTFKVAAPASVRALLGGTSGSILDAFGGGEYEFDNKTVKLYQHRGHDNGVTIRYGKNLTDITADTDAGSLYNAVIPYWSNAEDTIVYGGIVQGNGGITREEIWTDEGSLPIQDENGETITFRASLRQVVPMDLSGEFTEAPTVAQLEARAQTILNNNEPWIPKVNIKIDFIALWQTEEYKNIAPLERVSLCDTVTVQFAELGVDATAKVIRVVWDVLAERYSEMELGDPKTSFADVLMANTDERIDGKIKDLTTYTDMENAIAHATELITGGIGGHIVFLYDANKHPTDMLVMDTDDVSTAVHVLRINVNGLGFSSNGIQGPYTSAWTLDSRFNADFIVAGTMSAARIHGGTLVLGGVNNGNGAIVVYDASGNVIGRWNNSGIEINGGIIRTSDGERTSSIESGYTKYYTGNLSNNSLIGSIGTRSYQTEGSYGLEMDISYDADGIGWYASKNAANTVYDPVLVYVRDGGIISSGGVIVDDAIYANRDFVITSGYNLYGSGIRECELVDCRIDDPVWKMDSTDYNGVTASTTKFILPTALSSDGKITSSRRDCQMTFKHGILVKCTLPLS